MKAQFEAIANESGVFGSLIVKMFVQTDGKGRGREITVRTISCERERAQDLFLEFLHFNPFLRSRTRAIFISQVHITE